MSSHITAYRLHIYDMLAGLRADKITVCSQNHWEYLVDGGMVSMMGLIAQNEGFWEPELSPFSG